jgi:hypothetical protein
MADVPPSHSLFSITRTLSPPRAVRNAAEQAAEPEPMTRTSQASIFIPKCF